MSATPNPIPRAGRTARPLRNASAIGAPDSHEPARSASPPRPARPTVEPSGAPRYACAYPARVASSDRDIYTLGRIVSISVEGAKVEVMFPRRGPSSIMLFDLANNEIYECEVKWRTDDYIGVRFLDVFGPGRRRMFFAGETVPLKRTDHRIIQLPHPPKEELLPDPPPRHFEPAPPREKAGSLTRIYKHRVIY